MDLPAQFLQTEMDEVIHFKVNGPLTLLPVEHDTATRNKHLRKENKCPAIYVICNKAIYGTLNAAILAYKKQTKFNLIGIPLLTQSTKDKFHELTAKILWLSQQGRPDLYLPIGFICTQVKESDDND